MNELSRNSLSKQKSTALHIKKNNLPEIVMSSTAISGTAAHF